MNCSSDYEARRFQNQEQIARKRATAKGHELSEFDLEQGWYAAVSTCKHCELLAAIDLSERPYLFGLAYKKECKGNALHKVA